MRANVDDLKEAVRAFLRAESWSVNRLAKEAGLTTSTISGVFHESWNPRSNTLQACLDVVEENLQSQGQIASRPKSNRLPSRLIDRADNEMFRQCVEIWKDEKKQFNHMLLHRFEAIGAGARLSAMAVGSDNRLRMVSYGPNAFGTDYDAEGKLLSDMPDRELFSWIEDRLWRILESECPEFATCVAPTKSIVGEYDVPYTTLVLPCTSRDDGIVDSLVSVSRLEPSTYRDRIARIGMPHTSLRPVQAA